MMTIELIILDLDEVLHNPPRGFWSECDRAAAKAACQLGFGKDMDAALVIAQDGFQKYGHPCGSFIEQLKLDHDQMVAQWFKNLDFSYIETCPVFTEEMQKASQKKVVLTHSPTFWGDFILELAKYQHLIDDVVGLEKYEGRKDDSVKPFEYVLDIYNIDPKNTVMIDDQSSNLRIPKDMGMKSVLITNSGDKICPYAHRVFDKVYQPIQAINNKETPFF